METKKLDRLEQAKRFARYKPEDAAPITPLEQNTQLAADIINRNLRNYPGVTSASCIGSRVFLIVDGPPSREASDGLQRARRTFKKDYKGVTFEVARSHDHLRQLIERKEKEITGKYTGIVHIAPREGKIQVTHVRNLDFFQKRSISKTLQDGGRPKINVEFQPELPLSDRFLMSIGADPSGKRRM
jgi:hypothetical protein